MGFDGKKGTDNCCSSKDYWYAAGSSRCGWYDITQYDMIWHNTTWYDITQHDMIWHNTTWYDMTQHNMIWYDMIWYDMT